MLRQSKIKKGLCNKEIKLHIGAFDKSIDGWINTDITPHLIIGKIPMLPYLLYKLRIINHARYLQHKKRMFRNLKYMDVTRKLPFPDNSVDAVYSSHLYEHLFLNEAIYFSKEIHRVLKPKGVCRIAVPDLENIMKTYNPDDLNEFIAGIFETTSRTKDKNHHHSVFTGSFLCKIFREAGFSIVIRADYMRGNCPDVELLDNRPDSLFVEAIK